MAKLTTAQRSVIEWVLEYQNGPTGATEHHIDGKSAEQLSRLHEAFGFDSQMKFMEHIGEQPISTLLKAILAVDLPA